jgi:pimeloyl-ACP methyl ester carboxylesterase
MEIEVDGERAFVATGGRTIDPDCPTLVLVHGAGMDHTVWALQSRYLAHHGRNVLVPDLPGHGRSAGAAPGDVDAMAEWLFRMCDVVGCDTVAVAGHSMGSLVALSAAARRPERVRALSLFATACPMTVGTPLLDAAAAGSCDAVDMITLWGIGASAQLGGNPAPGLWVNGMARRLLERARPGVLHADLGACNSYQDGLGAAARVACPTVVVVAAGDRMTPPRAAAPLIAALSNSRRIEIPDCGHMMMIERPDAVLEILSAHL